MCVCMCVCVNHRSKIRTSKSIFIISYFLLNRGDIIYSGTLCNRIGYYLILFFTKLHKIKIPLPHEIV